MPVLLLSLDHETRVLNQHCKQVPPSQVPLQPDEQLPAFGYGPGGPGTGLFGAWSRAFEGWVGMEHLQAVLKLTGKPCTLC